MSLLLTFAFLACKTAPPAPLAQPAPATAVGEWGEIAARTEHDERPCLTFSEVVVAYKGNRLHADTRARAEGCALSDAAVMLNITSLEHIKGAAGKLLFLSWSSVGFWYSVTVFDVVQGQRAMETISVELAEPPNVDLQRRVLRYREWLGSPDGCAPDSAWFDEWRDSCWSPLQAAFPSLAGIGPPACTCVSGLQPFATALFERSLDDLKTTSSPMPPIGCSCSP